MKLNSKSINYNVQTVDELVSLDGLEGDTVVVTDEDRGGVFVYREDNVGTNNGGTIFNGWTRQYDGAVNVKWFGVDSSLLDNLSSITNVADNFKSYIFPAEIIKVSNALKIKGLSTVKSDNAIDTAYIGNTYESYSGINKTTNNTTLITNFQTGISSNVDCIAYIDPLWIDNGAFYPQGVSVKDISFIGNSIKNDVGLYIKQGGNFTFENISFSNTINSIDLIKCWLTTFKKVTGDGVFVHRGGTSTTLDNCWFKNGYSANALIYSSFNNCASDGASNIAYTFTSSKVVLNGCGCEGASTTESDRGTAISFNGGNNIEVNNFVCVPKNNQTSPIYSFGHNDYVVFNGGSSHYATGVTGADAHVWYAGATIIFNNYTFANGTQDNPVITFKPEAQYGSKVIVNYGANTKIYYCDNNGNTLVDGVGYKNVTSERVAEVAYTNTKGTPLNVSISLGLSSTTTPTYIYVNNSPQQILWNPDGQGIFTCTFIVPNNGTYKVSFGNPFINLWMESI